MKSMKALCVKFYAFIESLEPKIVGKRKALTFGTIGMVLTITAMDFVLFYEWPSVLVSILSGLLLMVMFTVLLWLVAEADTMMKKFTNGFLYAFLGFEFVVVLAFFDQPSPEVLKVVTYRTVLLFFAFGLGVTAMAHSGGEKKKCEPIPSL